jgi:hypothetical protein
MSARLACHHEYMRLMPQFESNPTLRRFLAQIFMHAAIASL